MAVLRCGICRTKFIVITSRSFDDFQISRVRRTGNVEEDTLSKWVLFFNVKGVLNFEDFRQVCFDEE